MSWRSDPLIGKGIGPKRIITAGLLLLLLTACGSTKSDGGKAYDFMLPTLDHGRFYLNQARGKVVVLCFWSTTCRHCHLQLKEMVSTFRRYDAERVSLAAVCTDPENEAAIRRFASESGITYPILLDSGGRVFQRFGGRGLPTTIILDEAGVRCFVRLGFSTAIKIQIEAQIDLLLDGTIAS
jgi:peroxiredoxin